MDKKKATKKAWCAKIHGELYPVHALEDCRNNARGVLLAFLSEWGLELAPGQERDHLTGKDLAASGALWKQAKKLGWSIVQVEIREV
jgi:hypothetical protein